MSLKSDILVTNGLEEKTIQFYVNCDKSPEEIGFHIASEAVKMNTNNPKYLARNLDAYYKREERLNIHADNDYIFLIDLNKRTVTCYFCLMFGITNAEAVEIITNALPKAPRLAMIFKVPFGASIEEIKASAETLKKKADRKYILLVGMQEREGFDGAIFEIEDFDKE